MLQSNGVSCIPFSPRSIEFRSLRTAWLRKPLSVLARVGAISPREMEVLSSCLAVSLRLARDCAFVGVSSRAYAASPKLPASLYSGCPPVGPKDGSWTVVVPLGWRGNQIPPKLSRSIHQEGHDGARLRVCAGPKFGPIGTSLPISKGHACTLRAVTWTAGLCGRLGVSADESAAGPSSGHIILVVTGRRGRAI